MAEDPQGANLPATGDGGSSGGGGDAPATKTQPEPDKDVLSLAQLIGAPISALIDAEAQTAMATARFIRQVGFTGDRDSENELGKLQMATFTRTARDASDPDCLSTIDEGTGLIREPDLRVCVHGLLAPPQLRQDLPLLEELP